MSENKQVEHSTIRIVWQKMAKIYGHKWISNFGDMDDGTWLAGLADFTEDDLKRGLQGCVTRADPWPPTLPEFRNLCLGIEDFETIFAKVLKNSTDPMALEIRKRVGSWNLDRDSEESLRKQAKVHYKTLCEEFETSNEHTLQGSCERIESTKQDLALPGMPIDTLAPVRALYKLLRREYGQGFLDLFGEPGTVEFVSSASAWSEGMRKRLYGFTVGDVERGYAAQASWQRRDAGISENVEERIAGVIASKKYVPRIEYGAGSVVVSPVVETWENSNITNPVARYWLGKIRKVLASGDSGTHEERQQEMEEEMETLEFMIG